VSPFVGLRLADMEPGGFLAGIGGSCIVSCCTFVTYVVSALLTWARNFLVFFYGVFFPIITFFYFFDLTKPYGRKWVQDAIKWIFLPIVQALILAFTLSLKTSLAATPVYIPGDVFSVFSPMMSTGVVLAGMLGFIAAPIIIGQLMSYIGTAISSIGLSTGRTWLVSAGGIMHGGFSGGPAQVAWAHAQMARDMSKNRLESSLAYSAGGQAYSVRPSAGGGGRAGAGGGGGGPAIGGGVAPGASGGGEDYGGGARGGGGRSGGRGGAPSASGGQGPIAREAGAQSGSERAEAGSPAAPGTQPKGDQYGFPSLGTMLSDAEYKGEPEKPKLSGTRPGVSEDGTELPFDDMLRQARGEVAGERQAGGGGAAQGEAREVQEEGSRFIQQRVQQKVPEATGTTEPLNLTDKVKQGKVIVEPTKYRTTKEDTGRTKAAPSAGGGAGVQRWAREKTEADNEAARSMEQAGVEAAREQGARDKEAEVKKEQAGIRAAREQGKKKEEAEVKKGEQDKKTANEEQKVDTKAEREK
ncbi:MAG: MFS transporter, partial [Candidatus Altiarchaeota archaeon]|nr:MFS transporter [Candidatus Altiarchaeota archaeon]